MEARVFVSCNQPWIKCICPSCCKVFSDFTVNYCSKCGVKISFNHFHNIFLHYDRTNLDIDWKEI